MTSSGIPVVIDLGSGNVKAGFATELTPSAIFPSIVGRPRHKKSMRGGEGAGTFVGSSVETKRWLLTMKSPLEHGIIVHWDDLELLIRHTFDHELRVDPTLQPILVTEPPLNPKANREHMAQLLFEKFGVPSFGVGIQATMALFASGRTTGLVLDSGHGVSHTVPIYQGYVLGGAVGRLNVGGREVTDELVKLMGECGGFDFRTSSERQIARQLKEKLAYVALDYQQELLNGGGGPVSYELPDGQVVQVGAERFQSAEVLFNTSLMHCEEGGIQHLAHTSITKADLDIRRDLWENVLLSGGGTMLRGLPERLEKELRSLVPQNSNARVRVVAPPQRNFSVWQGAAALASLSPTTQQQLWTNRAEYDEHGPSILHNKMS